MAHDHMTTDATRPMTRRRALTIMAAAGAALPLTGAGAAGSMPAFEWRGRALGGPARIAIRASDAARARRLVEFCVREIERLENIFSLYRENSEIARLNRHGRLAAPSHDLRLLLADARRYGALSDGAFDVTVQPLWRLYSGHFGKQQAQPGGPAARDIAKAAALVDYRGIDLDNGHAVLARRGMAVTLNGIAQGYITDRIADLLRDAGMTGVLVDLGEIRALDTTGAEPWRIGIEDPRDPDMMSTELPLSSGALATSGGYGTRFDAAGRFHHLFEPATGRSAGGCLCASALAPTAVAADALATALAVSPPDQAPALLQAFRGQRARLVLNDGRIADHTA